MAGALGQRWILTGVDPIAYLVAAATRAKRESAVLLPADFAAAA